MNQAEVDPTRKPLSMSPPAVLFQQRLHFARSSSSAPEAAASSHEFRLVYGEDLDRLGEDAVPEAWRRYGLWGLARLLADIAGQVVGGSQGNVQSTAL